MRAITRVATVASEEQLLETALHATASQLEKICRAYRRVMASTEGRPESLVDEERRRFVAVRDTDDGMVRIEARLRPEEAAVVLRALDLARRQAWRPRGAAARSADGDVSAETSRAPAAGHEPVAPLARADALVVVAEAYLSHASDAHGGDASPVELVVHVDAAALGLDLPAAADLRDAPVLAGATLDDGTAIDVSTAQRLACDARVVTVVEDAPGRIESTSRRTRRISAPLRRALRLRDDGCRFPGCTNRLTDAHHVVPWVRGGMTTLGNLCSLCRRHHRLVHESDYRVETSFSASTPVR